MATSLARQVDELRRLIEARGHASTTPVYLREGTTIPEGIAPERVIFVSRQIVDPPERADDPPLHHDPDSSANGVSKPERWVPLEYPAQGIA